MTNYTAQQIPYKDIHSRATVLFSVAHTNCLTKKLPVAMNRRRTATDVLTITHRATGVSL